MVITLIRDKFTPAETLGKMLIDRVPFCGTLEPPIVPTPERLHPCWLVQTASHYVTQVRQIVTRPLLRTRF